VLPDLTEDHLRELGLPMGARPTNTSRGCDISPNLSSEVALTIVPASALANANVPFESSAKVGFTNLRLAELDQTLSRNIGPLLKRAQRCSRGSSAVFTLRLSFCRFHARYCWSNSQQQKALENVAFSRALSGCGDRI
jgi:hypothetical protein